jgi:cephalosporin hydroxylase
MPGHVFDDTHSNYHAVKSEAAEAMQRGVWTDRFDERFVPFSSREMRCDLPREAIKHISAGKHYISYRGMPMAKDPFDLLLCEMLFFELLPGTIIELGAYTGASALWMQDRLNTFDIKTRVISVDIDLSLVDDAAKNRTEIEFIEGDCNHIAELFTPDCLGELSHPLILIDDAHVNTEGVYRHFHQHAFRSGDYLIVEDTIPWIPGSFGIADDKEWGDWKSQEIQAFFAEFADDYRVDRYYTDFFGYNATWNWNGYIKRT